DVHELPRDVGPPRSRAPAEDCLHVGFFGQLVNKREGLLPAEIQHLDEIGECHDVLLGNYLMPNKARAFLVVCSAMVSGGTPFTFARQSAVCLTKAGSLRLPRTGTGAR